MYNSFIYKKHSQQLEKQQILKRKGKQWTINYNSNVRPVLIQKYSRRINNFITRIEQDKKDFYQYRQETQGRAHSLLKQIYRKEKFVGDPNIKHRDTADWTSMLSPTQRLQKQKNQGAFEHKYGDSNIAYRSIASQSEYRPPDSTQFRQRYKPKEIHNRNMRFTSKAGCFSQNKREKEMAKTRLSTHPANLNNYKSEFLKEFDARKSTPNRSYTDQEVKSHAFSVFSAVPGEQQKATTGDGQSSVSNHREPQLRANRDCINKNKVYFKQLVDLQQNSREPTIKKSLHQILVRFGLSRIKDLKKQAMAETDTLSEEQF